MTEITVSEEQMISTNGNGHVDNPALLLESLRLTYKLHDVGNSQRFAIDHQDTVRHAWGRGWLIWDGQRWRPDDTARVVELAKESARITLREASEILKGRGPTGLDAEQHSKWAIRSHDATKIRSAIDLARSDDRVSIRVDELDRDPWLLNAANGTIDLRTGELRGHDPADLITNVAGADYDPDARSPRFERFICELTGGNVELARWLQRAAGYSATGLTIEEIIIFIHGPGATGKTTLLETLAAALGTYAQACDFTTFLHGRNDGSTASPDIARLVGKRLVTASEVAGGQRFNVAKLKSATGGERVVARQLYRDPVEFVPAFTLWFAGNDQPAIPADDDGAWRRMRLVPATNAIAEPDRDHTLKHTLTSDQAERAAVLAWIVQGAVDWHQHGLGASKTVTEATASYRQDNDVLGDWLTARCALRSDVYEMATALYTDYVTYARAAGEVNVLSRPAFKQKLTTGRAVYHDRVETGAVYRGLHLLHLLHPPTTTSSHQRARSDFSIKGAEGAEGAADSQTQLKVTP